MNVSLVALLAGLFAVPAVLLWVAHRVRRRSARVQAAFIGGATGHILAAVAAVIASMISPEHWQGDDFWRGLFGFWMLLVAPIIGATIGYVRGSQANSR